MRQLVIVVSIAALTGCGGGFGGGSYTDRALDEFRAGNGYDWREKKKRPGAADVATVEKRLKNYPAGSTKDFVQGMRVLSNQREHDDIAFDTFATSKFLRPAYLRVFGEPDSADTRETPNRWTHKCTDGSITLRGFYVSKAEPNVVVAYPRKPKN